MTAVVAQNATPPVPADNAALMQIISRAAADSSYDVGKLQALLNVKQQWDAEEARKAFVVALNAFKANPPEVLKDKAVSYGAGNKTAYKHAGLDRASEIIGAALAQHGISHRWDVEQNENKIRVTCILTHTMGHSERVTMEATPDTSGSKNSIQAIGSTVSYLQRYTLFAASGVAPKNVDDDGRGGGDLKGLDEKRKLEFGRSIDALTDHKKADVLWQGIAQACTEAGDVAVYEELKKALTAKVKTLKGAAPI